MVVKPSTSFPPFARLLTLPFLSILLFGFAHAAENIRNIHPAGYVTDLAGVMHADTKTRLEILSTEIEQKTDAQMAIVTVHSLDGESIEEYAVDLYKQLGVGSKKGNRGVLLLLSPGEHRYRVEVGYGLEPVINDARAGDAGRAMVPFLRRGDYDNAILTAAWQLANYIAEERGVTLSGSPPGPPIETGRAGGSSSFPFWPILIVILIVIRIMSAAIRNTSGRRPRGGGGWWIGPLIGGMSSGGFGGSSNGWGGGGGFGGFGGGSSGGGGASGSW